MPDLAVADVGRLVEAGAGLHQHAAEAFVLEQRPALQHVDELHAAIVHVPFAVRRFLRAGADDVRHHLALGRALDAQIAILEIAAQAAALELRALQVIDVEAPAHGRSILR